MYDKNFFVVHWEKKVRVPESEDYSKQFANEFSLIFRQNGDLGNERTMSTPCPDEIESNLERLLFVWREKLKTETLQ